MESSATAHCQKIKVEKASTTVGSVFFSKSNKVCLMKYYPILYMRLKALSMVSNTYIDTRTQSSSASG